MLPAQGSIRLRTSERTSCSLGGSMRQLCPSSRLNLNRLCKTILALLCVPASAAATDLCDSAENWAFTFSEPAHAIAQGEQRCYSADLTSAGFWLVEVGIAAKETTEPSLSVSNKPCDQDAGTVEPAAKVLQRTLQGALLHVLIPGRYMFCISAQDPRRALGEHRITNLFAPTSIKGDPDEDEPDPHPLTLLPCGPQLTTRSISSRKGECWP